jgi:hypothetical protein
MLNFLQAQQKLTPLSYRQVTSRVCVDKQCAFSLTVSLFVSASTILHLKMKVAEAHGCTHDLVSIVQSGWLSVGFSFGFLRAENMSLCFQARF